MLLRNPFTRDARVLREARGLAAAGHDVTVLALQTGGLPSREHRDGFTVVRAVRAGRLAGPTIAGAAGGPQRRRLPRPTAAVWMRDRLLAARFARQASLIPADVYHAHDLNTLAPAIAAAEQHRAAVVYDAHELYPELTGFSKGERARWRRLESRLIHRADAVIVPSPSRGAALVRAYRIPEPAVVMNCPAASASPDPMTGPLAGLRRPGETMLVYAGGFTPNRGLENLVQAIELLDGCRLVMIGWGPLDGALRAQASNDRVVFLPAVDPDDVVGTVAGADIGMAPYLPVGLNNMLAAPNKLFEYIHAGLAVAASDLPDIRSVVDRHQIGALFDAASSHSIANAVGSIVGSPDGVAAMRRRAREAAPNYTWEAQLTVLLETYAPLSRPRSG